MTTQTIGYGDALNFDYPTAQLIITSPPYANQRKKTYGGIHPDKYAQWIAEHTEKFWHNLADTGSMVINIKENVVNGTRHPYVYDMINLLTRDQEWRLVDEYIWAKTTAAPGKWPNRFRDQWERIYHFTKQKRFTMNQDAVMVPAGDWTKSRLKNLSENDKTRRESATGSGVGRNISKWKDRPMVYPSNVLTGSPVTRNVGHSAAFPQWLPEFFIKLFSNPGDLVLDPFAGSGTTLLAAHSLQRSGIGVDNNPESYKTMHKRLTEHGITPNVIFPYA